MISVYHALKMCAWFFPHCAHVNMDQHKNRQKEPQQAMKDCRKLDPADSKNLYRNSFRVQ